MDLALKPQRGSDASDSNHMSGWLERDSTVSTDTAGQQRMISEFPVLAIFHQNAATADQVLVLGAPNRTLASDL